MNEKRRGDSERDDIRERIEFPAEGAFESAQAGDTAVQKIEDTGQ